MKDDVKLTDSVASVETTVPSVAPFGLFRKSSSPFGLSTIPSQTNLANVDDPSSSVPPNTLPQQMKSQRSLKSSSGFVLSTLTLSPKTSSKLSVSISSVPEESDTGFKC